MAVCGPQGGFHGIIKCENINIMVPGMSILLVSYHTYVGAYSKHNCTRVPPLDYVPQRDRYGGGVVGGGGGILVILLAVRVNEKHARERVYFLYQLITCRYEGAVQSCPV